ncbi:polyprenyl synthetase family protein [Levilactobacillus tujiorum]|uniref:Polyprenyl synthetase family protein n=1 Tax=Levilactobacillus tujiorum TaxID=2912243 RepID=A0ABX1L5Q7_9LACO|nr:farnesyl diphosphate synthase [Levilactobacillus tujiorum]MCH5465036.1 polyprenyl synthetase family protein [Levilactobacillus tujiorum]NLR12013.1 polyprenyl synthetase family protein [Lactobacillus sp. HBUAS51387]NLR29988.1 polyprenyl synthetase family protein [Levilactobacillus tujiorum]
MPIETRLTQFETTWVPRLNQPLQAAIVQDTGDKRLADAMTYSVMAGGKRLRPLLTVATLQALGVPFDEERYWRPVMALELLHTYSLIHDDLPAMDNDELRRGEPTNHVKFGAGMATLAGDGLLTLAFQWLTATDLSATTQAQLVQALAQAAGPSGMVAGQAKDIQSEHVDLPLDRLRVLHREKTGALLHYAVQAGLIMGAAPQAQWQPYLRFADAFGLAFQIYDDILDVVGTAAELGKATQKDAGEAKNTYPGKLGLQGANQALIATIQTGKQALAELPASDGRDLLAAFFSYFDTKRVKP